MRKQALPTSPKKMLGIYNTQRPELLPFGACSDAVNVVVDDAFAVEKRSGYTKTKSLTNATDLYGSFGHPGLFVINDGVLSTLDNSLNATAVHSGLTDTRMNWAELGDRVFYAGLVDAGIIAHRTQWQPLRIPCPTVTVTTPTGSGYTNGRYQVAATYQHDATGIEGPASPIQSIDLAPGKVLSIAVPALSGYSVKTYVSEVNGSIPYCSGVPLSQEQIGAQELPLGVTALAAEGGVLYAAIHDSTNDLGFVFWSQPFYNQCWRLSTDYTAVPGKVVGLASVPGGILILSTNSCWLWTADETLVRLADYGAPTGRQFARTHEGVTYIWTDHGVCLLSPDGWKNITEDHVSVPPGASCAVHMVESSGRSLFLVSTDGARSANNAYSQVAGKAWAVNIKNAEMTRYDDTHVFLSFATLNNVDYGLKDDGLYTLSGTTDMDSAIDSSITLAPFDFGTPLLKRCPYIYLFGCDDATITVSPIADGTVVGTYSGKTRVGLARGASARWWAFSINDTLCGPLRLTGIEVLAEPTTRRF